MQHYQCKVCGATLYWNTENGKLKCEYCDSEFDVSDFEDKTADAKASDEEELDKEFTSSNPSGAEWVVYKCENCGAEVIASKTTMATVCAHCGSAISITEKTAENFRPQKIIPYRISKEQAKEIYRKYSKSFPLAPDEFSLKATIDKMQNLFVPFYLNSMNVDAMMSVRSSEESSRRSGDDRVVTTTDYETVLRGTGRAENVPTDASKQIANDIMDALEPFPYEMIQAFNPAYMAGYVAEQPDENTEDMMERAERRLTATIDRNLLQNVLHASKTITGRDYRFTDKKSEYVMMPVWLLNVRYNDQLYTYAINGSSGKITGRVPLDRKKLNRAALKPAIIIAVIGALIGFLQYCGGIFL